MLKTRFLHTPHVRSRDSWDTIENCRHEAPSTWEKRPEAVSIVYYPYGTAHKIWIQQYADGLQWKGDWQYRRHNKQYLFLFFPPALPR